MSINCKYIYKNKIFNSEIELDNFILNGGIELINKYGDIALQTAYTLEKLNNIKKETDLLLKEYDKAKRNASNLKEEVLEFNLPYLGVSKFLKGLKNEHNKLLTPEYRSFDYWSGRIDEWLKTNQFNSSELEILGTDVPTEPVSAKELLDFIDSGKFTSNNITLNCVGTMMKLWYNQAKCGTDIHNVLLYLFTTNENGILNLELPNNLPTSKYLTPNLTDDIINYAKLLKDELTALFGNNLLFFPEFKIFGKLSKTIDNKGDTILGIIDLLVIDDKGNAHIIDYKTSPNNIVNSAKQRTYWYQLGLYHRMLAQHNITFDDNITMIAHILMENFRYENGKYVLDSIQPTNKEVLLEDITNNAVMYDTRLNLDEFIPLPLVVNLPPEEVSKKIQLFNDTLFSQVNISKKDPNIKKYIDNAGGILYNEQNNVYYLKGREYDNRFSGDSEADVVKKITKWLTETKPKILQDYINSTIKAFKEAIKLGHNDIELKTPKHIDAESSNSWLRDIIGKYVKNYSIIDNDLFNAYGVLVLQNNITHLLDFIKITTDDIKYKHNINGNKLLTGSFISDRIQARKQDDLTMIATTGNIYTMEIMALLNTMPEITKGGYSIGSIQVINPELLQGNPPPSDKELIYNFKLLIVRVKGFENNIDKINFADSISVFRNKLASILAISEGNIYKKFAIYNKTLTDLDSSISENDELKTITLLKKFINDLESKFHSQLLFSVESYDESVNPVRGLYEKAILALAQTKGIHFRLQIEHNKRIVEFGNGGMSSLLADNPGHLNNSTLNNLVTLCTEAYLNIREDVLRYMPDIRFYVNKLSNSKGFNKLKMISFGNAADLYKNMTYVKDGDLLFRNPWKDDFETEEEREFLKYALNIINSNRFSSRIDTEKMQDNIAYFRLPLVKGDLQSSVSVNGLFTALKNKLDRLNPASMLEDVKNKSIGIFREHETTQDDRNLFEMVNSFNEPSVDVRLEKIKQYGVDYFERNIENILIKHIFAYSLLKHINDVLPIAKASMIHFITQGNLSNQKFENAIHYITDYIRNKIKNEDLNTNPEFWHLVGKVRSAASFLILAFNPILYPGLLLQGLLQDIRLIIQNSNDEDTPFTLNNFIKAWSLLHKDMFKLGNKPTLMSLLNEFYGFNDMDMNTYSEKIKSDLYGIFNFTNLAYHCTSRPDFFNRMLIFTVYAIHDGVLDAYSVENGKLKYEFKKDKRFSLYASLDKLNINEYNKQKALYEVIAKLLINENALNSDGSKFKMGDPLPKAYSNKEIENIKSVSDTIFGYYTHEKKAMIHAYGYGALWMQMRTYWSGKKNLYLGTAGVKFQGKFNHLKNENGELLYYKLENNRLIPTTEITNLPIIKWEGDWQEGILASLIFLTQDLKTNGWKMTMELLKTNPQYRILYANIIQLAYDLTMFAMVGPIIAALLGNWSDDLEKEAKHTGNLDEALIATAARISVKSVNYGFLDFNFFESIGNPIFKIQPVSFDYVGARLHDMWEVAIGDRSFSSFITRSSSLTANTKPLLNVMFN